MNLVAKCYEENVDFWFKYLCWENYLQEKLFNEGISVPEPLGVYSVNSFDKKFYDGLVMEEIVNYKHMKELKNCEKEYVKKIFNKEIEKAKDLYFTPAEDFDNGFNALWRSDIEKLYLIDFTWWDYKDESYFDNFVEGVKDINVLKNMNFIL